jgi:uncharacterized protein YdeI (YjbR/CyaY-like superfamily)
MSTTDPRVDAYIAKSAGFAQPILAHLREVIHKACPQAEETIKWGMPHFMYGRRNIAHMAAFKAHAAFGFWHGEVVKDADTGSAMGQFGRIGSIEDLPSKADLAKMVKRSVALVDAGESVKPKPKAAPRPPPDAPDDLMAALKRSPRARKTYEAFPPSAKREYVEWITEAKRAETREKRLLQAIEWMEEGKQRNWKYRNC